MGVIRCSASALRSLTHKDKPYGPIRGRQSFAQLSHAMLKVEQPVLQRQSSKGSLPGWLFPATMAFVGLSFSTFCTHQLVATSEARRNLKSASSLPAAGNGAENLGKQE